jgi:hypothetical protein
MIYEFTILPEHRIDITTASARPPAITQTCQQVRQEARPMFFLKNKFNLAAQN